MAGLYLIINVKLAELGIVTFSQHWSIAEVGTWIFKLHKKLIIILVTYPGITYYVEDNFYYIKLMNSSYYYNNIIILTFLVFFSKS